MPQTVGISIGITMLQSRGAAPITIFSLLGIGQSLEEYYFVRGTPRAGIIYAEALRENFDLAEPNPFVNYNSGEFIHNGSSESAEDWTVKLINSAEGGTAVLDVSQPSNIPLLLYWWNTQDNTAETGNPADVADSPGPLTRAAITTIQAEVFHPIDCVDWEFGPADSVFVGASSSNQELFYDSCVALIAAIRSARGEDIRFFIPRLGRANNGDDDDFQAIREVQAALVDDLVDVFISTEEYDLRLAYGQIYHGAGITSGSPTITLADTSGWGVNDAVVGNANIPSNAKVNSIVASTSITMNVNATGNEASAIVYRGDDVHLYPGNATGAKINPGDPYSPENTTDAQPFDTGGPPPTTHNEIDGFYQAGIRSAGQIAHAFGVAGFQHALGPSISLADEIDYGMTTIDVAVDLAGGTDITLGIKDSWHVELDGASKTISSIAKIDNDLIRLTLSSILTEGDLEVWPFWGSPRYANYLTDFTHNNQNSYGMPLQAVSARATVLAPATPGQALAARLIAAGFTPSEDEITAFDIFYAGLVTDEIPSHDSLWITAGLGTDAASAQAAGQVNWISGGFDLVQSGTCTWVADQYVISDGVSGALSTQFVPSVRAPLGSNYQLNSATIWVYVRDNIQDANNLYGVGNAFIRPRNASNQAAHRMNDNTSGAKSSITDASGLWASIRSSSSARMLVRNGVDQGASNGTTASVGLSAAAINLFNPAAATPALNQVKGIGILGVMTTAQLSSLKSRLDTLYTALGAT